MGREQSSIEEIMDIAGMGKKEDPNAGGQGGFEYDEETRTLRPAEAGPNSGKGFSLFDGDLGFESF